MRIVALIFSFFGFCGFLMLLNVEGYHFMPASAGPEGGLIDAGIGFVFGGGVPLKKWTVDQLVMFVMSFGFEVHR